jgi:hypothetical protein
MFIFASIINKVIRTANNPSGIPSSKQSALANGDGLIVSVVFPVSDFMEIWK